MTGTTDMTSTDLRAVVGAGHVRPASASDAIRGVVPQTVLEPADADQLSQVLRTANSDGLAVIPRGGGTKLEWGNRPRAADLLVSTSRLDQIVEHPWADLTVTVQAGCRIEALQNALRQHGQRLAIDPLWPDRATVGGVLSTNDTAAIRLRFGGLRDLIIGTTIALADGTLARSGGKVVKNVAGYDLSKLVTGALGTLGVITSATFRLHPLPQQARTLSAVAGDLDRMQQLVAALQDSKLAHTSLQARASHSGPATVDVLFEGTPAGVDAQTTEAQRLARESRFVDALPDVWQARQDLWASGDGAAILKISTLTGELANAMDPIRRLADAARVQWHAVFQATGIGWIRFDDPAEGWSTILRELREAIERRGGSAIVLRSPSITDPSDVWGTAGDAQPLMQAIKREFDPKGTLNPGRFVGGI